MHRIQRSSPRSQADKIADSYRQRHPTEAHQVNQKPAYSIGSDGRPSHSEIPYNLRRNAIESSSQDLRGPHDQRRPLSPTTEFLAQIPLSNGSKSRCQSDMGNNASSREHVSYQARHNYSNELNDMDKNQDVQSHTVPTLKRSATQSALSPGVEDDSKRQRLDNSGGEPFKGSVRLAMESNALNENSSIQSKDISKPTNYRLEMNFPPGEPNFIPPTKRITYAEKATQIDSISISSSRLKQLQEEEAVAQHKHKCGLTRRSEEMALELEHERQVLELRHQFAIRPMHPVYEAETRPAKTMQGVPPAISASTAGRTLTRKETSHATVSPANDSGLPCQDAKATSDHQPTGTTPPSNLNPETSFKEKELLAKRSTEQGEKPILNVVSDAKTSHRASPGSSQNINGQSGDAKRTQSRMTGSLFLSPAGTPNTVAKASADRQDDNDLPEKPCRPEPMTVRPSAPPKSNNHPTSSSSSSVQIKTSPSPKSIYRQRPPAPPVEPRRSLPPVKHLTCFFWQRGGCHKRPEDCSYAHYDTGLVATNPDTMKKRKRDDPWHYHPNGGR
ncbi:MAG: hypothetical protein Q9174_005017 [Haloplaca sp. 1 TL-2023]